MTLITLRSERVNPFTGTKSDQISPEASQEILHHTHSMKNLAFHSNTHMKDDYTTNSHYLTYMLLFRKSGRMCFLNLGIKLVREPPDVNRTESETLRGW